MKKTTELHKAVEKLDVTLCNTIIDAHPKSVLELSDEGDTPLHVLLKKIFSVHPNKYAEKDVYAYGMLVKKMMNARQEMSQYIHSLVTLCYFEDIHFSGCYPSTRHAIAVTLPQILCALSASACSTHQEDPSDEINAKQLEDVARYTLGDSDLADSVMVDRLLIDLYQKSYIK